MKLNKGKINITPCFPIISINETGYWIIDNLQEFLISNKSFYKNYEENIKKSKFIDADGILYKLKAVKALGYTNFLFGFSLKSGGVSYYSDVTIEMLKTEKNEDLLELSKKILNKKKASYISRGMNFTDLKNNLNHKNERKEIIEYLFFLVEPNYIFIKSS